MIPAAPSTGVNTITGEGLDKALSGAEIVVDVANSPSFEDRAVLAFFETSAAIFSLRKLPPKCGTMSRCLLSAAIAFPNAVTSTPSWRKRT